MQERTVSCIKWKRNKCINVCKKQQQIDTRETYISDIWKPIIIIIIIIGLSLILMFSAVNIGVLFNCCKLYSLYLM